MFLRHSAVALSRRAVVPSIRPSTTIVPPIATRSINWWFGSKDANKEGEKPATHEHGAAVEAQEPKGRMVAFEDVRTMDDLLPPGGEPGTVPTDENQSTGLERLEILGKMQGVDVFDMRPLDASRKGTLDNPIPVNSFGNEQFAGCTGFPVDSHITHWLKMTRERPIERCTLCGSVYRLEYVGPPDDGHGHGHGHDDHGHHGEGHVPNYYTDGLPELKKEGEVKGFEHYVREEYRS